MNHETLKTFCSKDQARPGIMRPFNQGGYTYATDGRIMVRVPEIEVQPIWDCKPPNAANVWPNNLEGFKPVVLPEDWQSTPEKSTPCEKCQGSGKVYICKKCDGTGEHKCQCCNSTTHCGDCHATGLLETGKTEDARECEDCEGAGKIGIPTAIFALEGGPIVNLDYAKKVMALPGARLYFRHPLEVMYFTFRGGAGVLMPMKGQ